MNKSFLTPVRAFLLSCKEADSVWTHNRKGDHFCTDDKQSLEMERQVICYNLGLLEDYRYQLDFVLVVKGLYSQMILKHLSTNLKNKVDVLTLLE